MNYKQVKKAYKELFIKMMKYTPDQAGALIYAEKLAELEDKYPEFIERIENDE